MTREPAKAKPVKVGKKPPVPRTARPGAVPGRVWHWYKQAWLSVPEPIHLADDYRIRCEKVLRGAVRFEFKPEYSEVWGYDAAGAVVLSDRDSTPVRAPSVGLDGDAGPGQTGLDVAREQVIGAQEHVAS